MFIIFHCFFLCVDAGLAFLLLLKCSWVFLLVPACWNRILSVACLQKCLFSAHCWDSNTFTVQMSFYLAILHSFPEFPIFPNPFFILYIVLLPSGLFSDNLWHFSSLILWKSIKSLFCFYLFCVSLVLTNVIVNWVHIFYLCVLEFDKFLKPINV